MAFRKTRQTTRWVASPVARSARTNGALTDSTDSDRASLSWPATRPSAGVTAGRRDASANEADASTGR
jgi:hypothetical protein